MGDGLGVVPKAESTGLGSLGVPAGESLLRLVRWLRSRHRPSHLRSPLILRLMFRLRAPQSIPSNHTPSSSRSNCMISASGICDARHPLRCAPDVDLPESRYIDRI